MHTNHDSRFEDHIKAELNKIPVDDALADSYMQQFTFPVMVEGDERKNRGRFYLLLSVLLIAISAWFATATRIAANKIGKENWQATGNMALQRSTSPVPTTGNADIAAGGNESPNNKEFKQPTKQAAVTNTKTIDNNINATALSQNVLPGITKQSIKKTTDSLSVKPEERNIPLVKKDTITIIWN